MEDQRRKKQKHEKVRAKKSILWEGGRKGEPEQ